MTPEQQVKEIQLKAQYSVLSELSDCFGKGSKHEAAIKINKTMDEILYKLELLNYEYTQQTRSYTKG
jgi:hypothetical protein